MMRIQLSLICLAQLAFDAAAQSPKSCRTQPGEPEFPTQGQWDQLNQEVGGRLIPVVPSAKFCHSLPSGNCTFDQWQSTGFRGTIPGAMASYNWEQDYLSNPPSLCFQNGTTCGQGNVPVFAINASSAADIQAGIKFASERNLKVSIKSSGHDYLGRSTAKGSLLLWTHYLRDINFTESFIVGGTNLGSAVTVGSGVALNVLYTATKSAGKMVVGGTAANVVAAGGYGQGGGHSAFSPVFGLAADNCLEYKIVTADGELITANEAQHSDLFWALRGGGGGSWGVVIAATFRTYPTFNATLHTTIILANTNETSGQLAELHAKHIFDWDDVRAGQYFYFISGTTIGFDGNPLVLTTYFTNFTIDQANAAMKPLLDDARSMNFTIALENATTALANDLAFVPDDSSGNNALLGSRLIPTEAYRNNASGIGETYRFLLSQPVGSVLGHLVAGGKVTENANVSSAINPKWRSAKAHVIVATEWTDDTTVAEVEEIKDAMTNRWMPALAEMTGEIDSGAYSGEADVREPNFQVTFFGSNYQRLLDIKKRYDPNDLFIVGAGVGSENWDETGLCRK